MYYVTLSKIESLKKDAVSVEVEGLAPDLPKRGNSFFMYGEYIDEEGKKTRYVYTTPVRDVKEVDGEFIFSTSNSVYILKNIKKAEVSGI